MLVARKIIDLLEHDAMPEEAGLELVRGGMKKGHIEVRAIDKFLQSYKPEDRLLKKALATQIEQSPLYIEPAQDIAGSFRFGWNRGMAMKLETMIRGRWSAWLNILSNQRFDAFNGYYSGMPIQYV